MAPSEKKPLSQDDELLANAIPIEDLEEAEDAAEPVELVEEKPAGPRATLMPTGKAPAAAAPVVEMLKPIDLADTDTASAPRDIRTFDKRVRHEDKWSRTPNTTHTGAIHVKSFVSKLRLDAIDNMDQQINQWLDQHPQYEVKIVTASVGALTGKLTEPALFLTVWV